MEENNSKVNLFYFNNTIKDYDLPETLLSFKSELKELFHIDSKFNEEINIIYILFQKNKNNNIEKYIEVKLEDDYKIMKERLGKEIKDNTILIEIENNLNNINERKVPETFEEEIQNVKYKKTYAIFCFFLLNMIKLNKTITKLQPK